MTDIYLRVVGRTDVGNVRTNNEDSLVVADLSGHGLTPSRRGPTAASTSATAGSSWPSPMAWAA